MSPLQRRTYRIWKELEEKLEVKAREMNLTPAKALNVILAQALGDVVPESVGDEPEELPEIAKHDAF